MQYISKQELSTYKTFENKDMVKQWADQYYRDALNTDVREGVGRQVSEYTGSYYHVLNSILRAFKDYDFGVFERNDFKDYEEEKQAIIAINKFLKNYELQEPVVVYRFTHIKWICKMAGTLFLRKRVRFSDAAFLSTTLLKSNLTDFARSNLCDCILKIYLPKHTKGACVFFRAEKHSLEEYEFLLPPRTTLQILKVHRLKFPIQIDCIVILPSDS